MIQLALDLTDDLAAFAIAKQCLPYVDILEAGTPLIKAKGIRVVKELKKFGLPVFADLKTFDAGELEANMAAVHGADYAYVLAASNDVTIQGFMKGCRRHGVKAVADLMNAPLKRALFLERIGG